MSPFDFENCEERVQTRIQETTRRWQEQGGTARLWARDASLWTDSEEDSWLGWLDTASESLRQLAEWQTWAVDARADGIEDVVVLGMGGSSLCPEVLAETFGVQPGFARLRVLDSTVPAQVSELQASLDLARSLFVVSSKSGTTIEADVLLTHFFDAAQEALGSPQAAARHFIAITDPGTTLEGLATSRGFRHVAYGVPTIGGRFSALSPFGMLPAVLAGIDVDELLTRARRLADACRPEAPADDNPGAGLGVALAALASVGRDKLTLIASPPLASLGTWLEQLVAESTGKRGQGIVPIAEEPLRAPEAYDADRVFVYARLATDASDDQDAAMAALARAGHPTLRLDIEDRLDLAAEFYRWEFAIAVAGALMALNPFDQPDVEAAKVAARELTDGFVKKGSLPVQDPLRSLGDVAVYADPGFRPPPGDDLVALLAAQLARIAPGDYFAINAYVAMSDRNAASLRRIRAAVGRACRTATTSGFGPRFLHSTGQLHKGGPNSGVFLQLTSDDARDIDIPGRSFSFGVLKQAQALGDFQVLCERGRRVLRLHVGPHSEDQLERIADDVERAAQPLEV